MGEGMSGREVSGEVGGRSRVRGGKDDGVLEGEGRSSEERSQ